MRIPEVKVRVLGAGGGGEDKSIHELFKGKKSLLFAVPGAFTPICSEKHLPGFLAAHDKLKAEGIEIIACLSVNDPFVMAAWAKQQQVEEKIAMIADGNGIFTEAVGQLVDETSYEMGMRSERYAAVFNESLECIFFGKDELSFADNVLEFLASQRAPEPRPCQCDVFS